MNERHTIGHIYFSEIGVSRKSPKLQTCDKQQPRVDWSHELKAFDGRTGPRCMIAKDDVRDVGLEAFGNKASQVRERFPRGQRRGCSAQAVQAWMD